MSEFKIGQKTEITRTFSYEDVKFFADLVGDHNPVHLDSEYAKTTIFGECIVHGMLTSSLFSTLIATRLPGPGAIYLNQELNFTAPVFHEQPVKAVVEVVSIKEEKKIMVLSTDCYNLEGKKLIKGSAVVKY